MTPEERQQAIQEEIEHREQALEIQRSVAAQDFHQALKDWHDHISALDYLHGMGYQEELLWQRVSETRTSFLAIAIRRPPARRWTMAPYLAVEP